MQLFNNCVKFEINQLHIVMGNNKNGTLNDSASRVEAIKDLIFGENMKDYESRFIKLTEELEQTKTELNEKIALLSKESVDNVNMLMTSLSKEIDGNFTSLQRDLEKLSDKKVDKTSLGNLLINLGEKIKK